MEQQSPTPLTGEAPEAPVASYDPAIPWYIQGQHSGFENLDQSGADPLDALINPDIDIQNYPNPDPWPPSALTPETSTSSASQERCYINDQQSLPAQNPQTLDTSIGGLFTPIAALPNESITEQYEKSVSRKGKKQPRSGQSAEARQNRQVLQEVGGQCLRCLLYHLKCKSNKDATGRVVCEPCADILQPLFAGMSLETALEESKWAFPCIRNFSDVPIHSVKYTENVHPQALIKFENANLFKLRTDSFDFPLNFGFAGDIIHRGREFIPKGNELLHSQGVSSDESSQEIIPERTLPIHIQHIGEEAMRQRYQEWLDNILKSKSNNELFNFPELVFRRPHFGWVVDTLDTVCKFFKDPRGLYRMYQLSIKFRRLIDKTLVLAFETAILKSVLVAVPHIPGHAVSAVVGKLEGYKGPVPKTPEPLPKGSVISPRMVTKATKRVALHLYKDLSKSFRDNLTTVLTRPKNEIWGFVFCIMILHIVVIDTTQVGMVDQYVLDKEYNPDKVHQNLFDELLYLETNFVHCPIKVFQNKYKQNPFQLNELQGIDPATKRLIESVKEIFSHGDPFQLRSLSLRSLYESNSKIFAANNLPRLLTQFIEPFFRTTKEAGDE